MANITPTSITCITKIPTDQIKLGETCAPYDLVYFDQTQQKWYKGDKTDVAKRNVQYMLIEGGGDEDYAPGLKIASGGTIRIAGDTMTQQDIIVLSTNGKWSPLADLASTQYLIILGHAKTTTDLQLHAIVTSTTKP